MNKINKTKNKTIQSLEDDVVLRVENLSKKFCRTLKRSMYYGTIDIARSMMGINYDTGTLRKDEFWALDDISFELKKGETLGIIGENGSGKSTLLRLITGIFPPDKGKISFKGRIGALIAVGAGFHPHMTGRENVYLNGTILGMTRKELDERLDDIIDFAEIGEFLDAPVSTYSSGMRVRLGFAIAVHCEPDILLVDEVLSVGDLAFRNKSLRKMNEFRKNANSVIFISHDLEQIRVLCDRTIVLNNGKIEFNGDTHKALVHYEEKSSIKRVHHNNLIISSYEVDETFLSIHNFGILDKNDIEVDKINLNDQLRAYLDFEVKRYIEELNLIFALYSEDGKKVIWVRSNDFKKFEVKNIKQGIYRQEVVIEEHNLGVGVYFLSFGLVNSLTLEKYTKLNTKKAFRVVSDGKHLERGVINVKEKWNLICYE